jgi:hypothetical protein
MMGFSPCGVDAGFYSPFIWHRLLDARIAEETADPSTTLRSGRDDKVSDYLQVYQHFVIPTGARSA